MGVFGNRAKTLELISRGEQKDELSECKNVKLTSLTLCLHSSNKNQHQRINNMEKEKEVKARNKWEEEGLVRKQKRTGEEKRNILMKKQPHVLNGDH